MNLKLELFIYLSMYVFLCFLKPQTFYNLKQVQSIKSSMDANYCQLHDIVDDMLLLIIVRTIAETTRVEYK